MSQEKPTLVLCLNEYYDSGLHLNPLDSARALGVSWEEFVPCPMAEQIILKGCAGPVHAQLPRWLRLWREA